MMIGSLRKNAARKLIAVIAAVTMVISILPVSAVEVPADVNGASAEGGIIYSNDANSVLGAFGSENADASYEDSTLTITLNEDIILNEPAKFIQGQPGDRVVLNLNGHSACGADGIPGGGYDEAKGTDAVMFGPTSFDLEIRGPGSVYGGNGAVFYNEYGYPAGGDGGRALCIDGPVDEEFYDKLEHGISVTGGAVLKGGDGAGITAEEWQNAFEAYAASHDDSAPGLIAGDGGDAIGQPVKDIDTSYAYPAYAKIEIINGLAEGGRGGSVDFSGITPTVYALMTNTLAETVMQGEATENADQLLGNLMGMIIGAGGDGLRFGAGRKYVFIDTGGTVRGGSSGSASFGDGETFNRYSKGYASPGDGIAVYGDIGLTNDEVDFSSPDTKDKDSNDMGMYIAGTVSGGDSPDAFAMNENTDDGGAGISLHGEERYGNRSPWGIIDIEGNVTGGNAGDAVSGNAGSGGPGLLEAYTKGYDFSSDSPYGTDHFIINGNLTGGNGGTAFSNGASTEGRSYSTVVYVPAISRAGNFGHGGIGLCFGHYREDAVITGSGTVSGGNAGNMVKRDGEDVSDSAAEAVYTWPENYLENLDITAATASGNEAAAINKDQIKVTASMTSFSDQPSANTELSCTIEKPSGYTGNVYIQWVGTVYPNIGYSGSDYAGYPNDIESSGTGYTKFKLLGNSAYKYLAYPMYPQQPDLGMYDYNYYIATADRFSDLANVNCKKQICCYVLLEDGRWGKSNVMEWTKGWNGGGGSDPEPGQTSITSAKITGISDKTYTGSAVTQSPVVKIGSTTLKSGTHYTLSYKNNKKVGTATVTITGKGKYTDSVSKTFRICFKDVPMSHAFSSAVYWANDRGIAAGYSGSKEGTFGVRDDITRGQVVMFLWRAAGQPAPAKNTQTFKDVPVTHAFFKAIQWAVEEGITGGYTGSKAGYFGPNDNCTRGQIATFLWRYDGRKAPEKHTQTFSDVPVKHSFYKAIQWAAEQKITTGYKDGRFGVNDTCTRGQCVTFLYRLLK